MAVQERTGSKDRPERIFICSPLRPRAEDPDEAAAELEENLSRARRACRLITDLGALPYAPHIYATQFLDDGKAAEWKLGLALAQEWLRDADECWVFSEHISEGMAAEIALASELDIPVRMVCESGGLLGRMQEMLGERRDA